MYIYVDYFDEYNRVMQFNKNKNEPFHKWYPFVEGYSSEFIQSILEEVNKDDNIKVCLEPFSGSGTTALELQKRNIDCYSFEVNPLMYLIARTKLEQNYSIKQIAKYHNEIKYLRKEDTTNEVLSDFKTLYPNNKGEKWNYHVESGIAITKLLNATQNIKSQKYRDLFMLAIAGILLDVSNLYRNGKCLSYKKNWKNRIIKESEVFEKFDNKINEEFIFDLENHTYKTNVNNKEKLHNLDSRIGIERKVLDNTIDLVITSPPYLNSRDYTDSYMLELKTLGFTETYEDIKKLRNQTIRSHVQVKWQDKEQIKNILLENTLQRIESIMKNGEKNWNNSILDMIRLYFVDMNRIFFLLYKKMKKNGKVYFNVSNSAYFGVLINTVDICSNIAENQGFCVKEIRRARYLNPSPQQKDKVPRLLEAVIVLEKR